MSLWTASFGKRGKPLKKKEFLTYKQSKQKKTSRGIPNQTSGGRNGLMNSVIKTQVQSKTLSSMACPRDLKQGRKLAWNKGAEMGGGIKSHTVMCSIRRKAFCGIDGNDCSLLSVLFLFPLVWILNTEVDLWKLCCLHY